MITDRLKQQLLWAFGDDGDFDAEAFAVILRHEHVVLSAVEMTQLVHELTLRTMPTLQRKAG